MLTAIGQCSFPSYDGYGLVCDEARFLCGYEMDGYAGTLLTAKSPLPQPDPLCSGGGEADNIQWFSFLADDSNLEIVIRYSNCTNNILAPGLQVGIFESCELESDNTPLGSIYCIQGTNYTDIVLTPDAADIVPGQLYLLFVDGYAGSACEFEIEVVSGVCVDEPDTSQVCEVDCGVMAHYAGDHGCTLFQDTFSFTPSSQIIADVFGCNPHVNNLGIDSIICVEWNIQPDMGFNFISSSFEFFDSIGVVPTLVVEWTMPGTYTIEPIITFNPLFSNCQGMCDCTDDVVFTIDVTQTTFNQLQEIELCPGECVDFCDQTYCQTGIYECYNRDLCLVEIQPVIARPNVEIDLGEFFVCPGACYEFQSVMYCDADDYEISDAMSCDTTYLFGLEELIFTTSLAQADNLINCTILQAVLEGEWNTNFTGNIISAWISETGDTLAHGTEYIATGEGDYTFVAWPENMNNCEISITHRVNVDDAIPTATLITPLLDCNNPTDSIVIDTQDDILSVDWNGPNGLLSNAMNLAVDEGGMYEAVITATNGCQVVLQTEVIGDFENPDLAVDFENLTCSEDVATASFTTTASIVSQQWTLPDASASALDVLNLNVPGSYALEITGDNGCTATENFNVLDLSYDPSLQLNEDRIWRCTDTLIVLDLSAQEVPGLRYTWRDLEGALLSNTINLSITSPGKYILTTVDDNVQCIGRDTVQIVEDPNPFLDIEYEISPPLCEDGVDGSIEVMTLSGGTGPFVYQIDGEEYSDLSVVDFEAGMYTVDAFDVFGCLVSKDIEVPATQAFSLEVEPELMIRFGQTKTLTFETSLDDSEVGYIEWSDPEGEILGTDRELDFVGKQIEFINLWVENLNGCEVLAQIKIDLSFEVDIYYPNVFSPNNDGNNDLFILYNNGFPEMADDLKIFDRSGELIYKSSTTEFNETKVGWDGTFNGKPCQPGVYVFILQYTLMNGSTQTISGSITLVR